MALFSSPALELLGVPTAGLSRKKSHEKVSGDGALDFIKQQQRLALVETVDMLVCHSHIRQAVRDYAHGLLAAASQQKLAIQDDHFAIAPATMGKVDEEFVAGFLLKHTKLTVGDVSKCRAFDNKFSQQIWLLLMNSMGGVKLPPECKSKPVLAGIGDDRVKALGCPLASLSVDGKDILANGKVNWGRIGIYRATMNDSKIMCKLSHLYSNVSVDIEGENITEDFTFDNNWNPRQAQLVRGSRKHDMWDFFSPEDKKTMAPWCGRVDELTDMARLVVDRIRQASSKGTVEVARADILKDTQAKRSQAMVAARGKKLQLSKGASSKGRRISVGEATS